MLFKKMQRITLKHGIVDKQKVFFLEYLAHPDLQSLVSQFMDIRNDLKSGRSYIYNDGKTIKSLFDFLRGKVWIDIRHISSKMPVKQGHENLNLDHIRNRKLTEGYRPVPESFLRKLETRRYSYNTAKVYITCFERFINYYSSISIDEIGTNDIQIYLQHLSHEGKSSSYLNQTVNGIKFYYEQVLGMPGRFYHLDRPRKEKKLPVVLSKSEVQSIISSIGNIKHKVIIALIYSAGLRRGELINLKVEHIDSKRMTVFIKGAKGSKDRYSVLSEKVLGLLRRYYKTYEPQNHLFEGPNGQKYSGSSIRQILKRAVNQAKINKYVTPHVLRHSFATT